jgi:hypothetical protein
MICTWKPVFKQIGSSQGVEITYQHKRDVVKREGEGQVHICEPTDAQLSQFSHYLKSALQKYPDRFLEQVGVSAILLSGKIIMHQESSDSVVHAAGMMFGRAKSSQRWIILDASQNNIAVIHHEIFHYLSECIDMDALPDMPEKNEFYADLFAELMLKPSKEDTKGRALRNEVSRYCSGIRFAEHYVNSNTQIWTLQNNTARPIIFGETPSDNADFVSDITWHEQWHENNSGL